MGGICSKQDDGDKEMNFRKSGATLLGTAVPEKFEKLEDLYNIQEELGKGAFSHVKKAVNKKTGQVVALKMIPNSVFNKNREQTEREVKILQKLGRHEHIVHLLAVHRGKKHFTISMELLTGGELFDRICKKEKYTEQDAKKVTKQLLQAIKFLHSKNIAHRDLKPENAIFASPAEDAILKVSDFGFANVYDPNNKFVATCGTPLYVAPEIIDCVPYNVQCDMWSLGVIVFILLCGYPPFYGDDDEELFARIRGGDYEFMSPAWDNISKTAKNFIDCCFQTNPEKRITAKDALKHPWIVDVQSTAALGGTLDQLKRTQCKRKLIKGIEAVIAMKRMERLTL
eukprot:c19829_g2_i1.p1 GENE.c19829_g2_i1~~c19829_g2_i1.p1  ORF type:complete len:341 (-),score=115.70 c19829_g2_i1:1-1023(-)